MYFASNFVKTGLQIIIHAPVIPFNTDINLRWNQQNKQWLKFNETWKTEEK